MHIIKAFDPNKREKSQPSSTSWTDATPVHVMEGAVKKKSNYSWRNFWIRQICQTSQFLQHVALKSVDLKFVCFSDLNDLGRLRYQKGRGKTGTKLAAPTVYNSNRRWHIRKLMLQIAEITGKISDFERSACISFFAFLCRAQLQRARRSTFGVLCGTRARHDAQILHFFFRYADFLLPFHFNL